MKHTRGSQTVRRNICAACYRNDVDSKPFFRSRIRNQIAESSRRSKKSRMDRTENLIAQQRKNILHTLCLIELLLGLIDVVQCLHFSQNLRFLQKQRCHENNNCRALFHTQRVSFTQTLYLHQSALPYMGCCTLSSRSSPKGPMILGPIIQQTKVQLCIVHDVVVDVVVDDFELLQR